MPLVTTKQMLLDAQKNRYAVGAFNFENMEMGLAIVAAAEKMNVPVMLQTTLSTTRYSSISVMAALGIALAEQAKVPVALHLDHGNSFAPLMQALRAGYTSIMIDGSHESLQDNISITKRVVDVASPMGIPVEAELGKVGGKEDDVVVTGAPAYTDPDEAAEFVEKTGVDSLAVGIGTAHGFYKGTPKLAVDVLTNIQKAVEIPLVLHGASGLLEEDIRECIRRGICKVNFATELRAAYTKGVQDTLTANPDTFDPKEYGKVARQNVMDLVCSRIAICANI